MELTKLQEYLEKEIEEIKLNSNSITLTFIKKILFFKKKISFKIEANEDISSLKNNNLEHSILLKAEVNNMRLTLTFKQENKIPYTIVFKIKDIILL